MSCQEKGLDSTVVNENSVVALKDGGIDWEESADDDQILIAAIGFNGKVVARCVFANPNNVCVGFIAEKDMTVKLFGYDNFY